MIQLLIDSPIDSRLEKKPEALAVENMLTWSVAKWITKDPFISCPVFTGSPEVEPNFQVFCATCVLMNDAATRSLRKLHRLCT